LRRTARTILLFLVACGDDSAPGDAGTARLDAASCTPERCSDGVYCNGDETCSATGDCIAATEPRCASGQTCSEVEDRCRTECDVSGDADGDGADSSDCGGNDCDDGDARRFPGATEICDAADLDEDCDVGTFGERDSDGDTHPDALCCNVASDGTRGCGSDCDDARSGSNPDVPEACDGLDNDCDGTTDETVLLTFYRDIDGDDYGNLTMTTEACSAPDGFAVSSGDCDDERGSVHPGALEICDERDNDCDGDTDPGCDCTIGTSRECGTPDGMGGFLEVGQCRIGSQICVDGEWGGCTGDVRPLAESCNGADDDCDGASDEGVATTCYPDVDNDSWAPTGPSTMTICGSCPSATTARAPLPAAFDCDDTEPSRHPANIEICDRIDSNCSTPDPSGVEVSEDFDEDGYAPVGAACTGGLLRNDCYDFNPEAHVGQINYYGVDRGDGSYDYDCDGSETQSQPSMARCDCGSGCDTGGRTGWASTVPACGDSGSFVRGCSSGAMCPTACTLTLMPATQACR
jgi:hypothetical protein